MLALSTSESVFPLLLLNVTHANFMKIHENCILAGYINVNDWLKATANGIKTNAIATILRIVRKKTMEKDTNKPELQVNASHLNMTRTMNDNGYVSTEHPGFVEHVGRGLGE